MRVLIVETSMGSGDWHYANMIASALVDVGVDASVVSLSPVEPFPSPRPIPVYTIGPKPPGDRWPRRLSLRRAAHHVAKVWRLLRLIRVLRPNIVHFQKPLGTLDFLYMRLVKSLGPRLVYTIHTPLPPMLGRAALGRLREVDLILTHARRTEAQLVAAGLPEGRIKVIYHGNYIHLCRPRDLSPEEARRRLGLPPHSRALLFFGSIEWRKGLDCLIESFALLTKDCSDLYLVIAGYPNEDFGPYETQLRREGIRERVVTDLRWLPFSEMQTYFHAASVVVLPYRRISQSGVLQLAYAYERPLVVTDVGGIAETILEDETGLVAGVDDPASIARAVRELLSDPERAAEMGRRARRYAETKYSWAQVAQRVAELYKQVDGGSPGPEVLLRTGSVE